MDNLLVEFGQTVKTFRRRKRLSQGELAQRAGLTQPYISMLEKGEVYPQKDKLVALCEVLDLDIVFKVVPRDLSKYY